MVTNRIKDSWWWTVIYYMKYRIFLYEPWYFRSLLHFNVTAFLPLRFPDVLINCIPLSLNVNLGGLRRKMLPGGCVTETSPWSAAEDRGEPRKCTPVCVSVFCARLYLDSLLTFSLTTLEFDHVTLSLPHGRLPTNSRHYLLTKMIRNRCCDRRVNQGTQTHEKNEEGFVALRTRGRGK